MELALATPLLLLIFLGLVEAATAYDRQHTLTGLSREAANIASRGTDLQEVVGVVMSNGSDIALGARGGTVVTRITLDHGVAEIVGQTGTAGYVERSRMGALGETAAGFDALGLVDGHSVHVVEIFYDYDPFTPLSSFVSAAVPDGLYSRAVF